MFFADNTIIMSKGEIKCLLAHMSRDVARVNLCTLVVDFRARRAFATDGHRLAVACASPTGHEESNIAPVCLPPAFVEQAAKYHACRITAVDGRLKWEGFDRQGMRLLYGKLTEVDAKKREKMADAAPVATGEGVALNVVPPPINMVIPTRKEYAAAWSAFNPAYLADLALLTACEVPTVRFHLVGELDPALVTGESLYDVGTTHWTMIVMPKRV